MITNWKELGDTLAEIENRLSTLENSLSSNVIQEKSTRETIKVTNLTMTDTQISYLRKNLLSYIDKELKEYKDKVDKQKKYKEYIS